MSEYDELVEKIHDLAGKVDDLVDLALATSYFKKLVKGRERMLSREIDLVSSGLSFLHNAIKDESVIVSMMVKRFFKKEKSDE